MASPEANIALRVFDPAEDAMIVQRKLPHWSQPGTICFITFRTWDSMPKPVVARWLRERWDWLRQHGVELESRSATRDEIDPPRHRGPDGWREQLLKLDAQTQREFYERFSLKWHEQLNQCHGDCVLRQSEMAQIVAQSLNHFNGSRYDLTDLVVMPNHVHLLAAFRDGDEMLGQCASWKHFTATQINRRLHRKGRFWQQDGFDHLVRSLEQFEFLRRYIADNPKKANIGIGEYFHESKLLK